MADFSQPLEQLEGLFPQAAKAVIVTQAKMDQYRYQAGSDSGPGIPLSFSIPRAGIELSFGLDVDSNHKVIIPFISKNKGQVQRHGHNLSFKLIAVPDLPPAPNGSDTTGQAKIPIQVLQPHFLVSPSEQDERCRQLVQAMTEKSWDLAYPEHGDKPSQEMVNKECNRILTALTPDNPELGMVVLKLDTPGPSYLIVRVTDKSKKDGIFSLTLEPKPAVIVYSFENDDVDNIRYAGLHEMARTIRHWLTGAPLVRLDDPLPKTGATDSPPSGMGLIALDEFTQVLARGYLSGLKLVSEQNTPANAVTPLPSYYDLTDVEAELSYSVYYDDDAKRLRFSFGSLKAPDGKDANDETTVIESRVAIRAYRQNEVPQVEVNLVAPEFSLAGAARQSVINAVKVKTVSASIAKAFNKDNPAEYLQYLESEQSQREAVILLSYKGAVPRQRFLIVWPGAYKGNSRDFVFICEMKNGEIQEDSIDPILSLDQVLDPAGIAIGVEITGTQYEPFHNFFHAIRTWQSRLAGKIK
jgi:hypothetical protein